MPRPSEVDGLVGPIPITRGRKNPNARYGAHESFYDSSRDLTRAERREQKRLLNRKPKNHPDQLRAGRRNGAWLDEQEFPELQYAVPDLVPEGVVLLVGPPKAGKSTLVRRIGLECARGGRVFGIKCVRRNVLYLALEDDDPSMQASVRELLGDARIPMRFEYQTEVQPGCLIDTVEDYLKEHPNGLVTVDTLGRVMEPARRGEQAYERDYRIMTELKTIARKCPGTTIIINHHSRKAKSEDFVDMVSGTHAIAGASDTIIVLNRKRGTPDGTWYSTSRKPMDDAEYALILERPDGWRLDGEDLEEATENASMAKSNLGERSKEVISYVNGNADGVTMRQISEATGIPVNQVKYYVTTALERSDIHRLERGLYGPLGPVKVHVKKRPTRTRT